MLCFLTRLHPYSERAASASWLQVLAARLSVPPFHCTRSLCVHVLHCQESEDDFGVVWDEGDGWEEGGEGCE